MLFWNDYVLIKFKHNILICKYLLFISTSKLKEWVDEYNF